MALGQAPNAIEVNEGGSAVLDQVAVIGLFEPTRYRESSPLQHSLIKNTGSLSVERSLLADSIGAAIHAHGSLAETSVTTA